MTEISWNSVISIAVECAKSSRSSCKACLSGIDKGNLRIGGGIDFRDHLTYKWYHPVCFFSRFHQAPPSAKELLSSCTDIKGFDSLNEEQQKQIQEMVENPVKKRKNPEVESKIEQIRAMEGELEKKGMTNAEMKGLLKFNNQIQSGNKQALIGRVAECMVLGANIKCPTCERGNLQFILEEDLYYCKGGMDEDGKYKKCPFKAKGVKRRKWKTEDDADQSQDEEEHGKDEIKEEDSDVNDGEES